MWWLKVFRFLFAASPKTPAPYVSPGVEGQVRLTARLSLSECALYNTASVSEVRRGQPASQELVWAVRRAYDSFRENADVAQYGYVFYQEAVYVLGQGNPEAVRSILKEIGAPPEVLN